MRSILKWLGIIIGGLICIFLIAAFIWREQLVRLYNVNTLFAPEKIVSNFSNMDTMFLSAPIQRAGEVRTLQSAPGALPQSFQGRDGLEDTQAFLKRTNTTSLLVLRDGKVEFEEYFLETGPDDLRVSWSVAKSFLSVLIGIAVADGKIGSMDDPVTQYVPALKGSAYEGATLAQVATMSSGVAFDEDYLDFNSDINKMGRELALGGSLDEFAAALKAQAGPPGQLWRYVSIDTHVLGMALRAATGVSAAEYMADKLWSRIGAEADAYYVTDGEGAAFVLGGLNIRTRDYARFGQMVLDGGRVGAEQIVPENWLRMSTSALAPPPVGGRTLGGYGYQWWLPVNHDDEVYAIGVYGQFIFIDRKARVVIVKTSADVNFKAENSRSEIDSIAFFRAVARP